jgi:hypothetical protein
MVDGHYDLRDVLSRVIFNCLDENAAVAAVGGYDMIHLRARIRNDCRFPTRSSAASAMSSLTRGRFWIVAVKPTNNQKP